MIQCLTYKHARPIIIEDEHKKEVYIHALKQYQNKQQSPRCFYNSSHTVLALANAPTIKPSNYVEQILYSTACGRLQGLVRCVLSKCSRQRQTKLINERQKVLRNDARSCVFH